ncbi:MAG: chitobiase/beta-hexosaminidase C-terminal domain-containing protein, partial [Lentisphaerae bacterium]|nr:chitobiase/beta-hexosaminidase C-terminal domain-containing protein [Lentisphaerota bacterium]
MSRYFNVSMLIIVCLIISSCATLFKKGDDLYPVITPDGSVFDREIKVYMGFPEKDVEIRYTVDGSAPDLNSTSYKEAVILKDSALIKVSAFKDGQSIGNTVQVKFTKQAPASTPKRTILFVIDSMNRQMFEKLPLENYNSLISKGVLYRNVANLLPISLPPSKEYSWNQLTSVPPLAAGTALIGTPELNTHLLQQCFTETTAFCS